MMASTFQERVEPTSGTFLGALYRYCLCEEADGACLANTYVRADDRGSAEEVSGTWDVTLGVASVEHDIPLLVGVSIARSS
jgi:hypothetical protein